MSDYISIQDKILEECIQKKIPVTLYTINGFQMRGLVAAKDNFVVVFESDGKHPMVYKNAISTLIPLRPLSCINNK